MLLPFDEFAIAAHVDEFAIAALIVVLVVGGMRLFYGSWPWEVRKTWYRTRQAVEYVEALCGEKSRDPAPPAPRVVGNAVDASNDSFDRSQTVYENRVMPPPQSPAGGEELVTSAQKSYGKLPIIRRGSVKSSRHKPKQIAETAPPTTGDPDSGEAAQPKQVAETASLTTSDSDSKDQAAR